MDAGRKRLEYMRREPRVSLTVLGADAWYRHVTLAGRVAAIEPDPQFDGIDRLSRHYMGEPFGHRERPRVVRGSRSSPGTRGTAAGRGRHDGRDRRRPRSDRLRLATLLSAHGEDVISLIRNPDHADDVVAQGGRPVVCDLEHAEVSEVAAAIDGATAVVFAAGAGAGSGAERKLTMDRDGAIKLLHAAVSAGVPRYVMISSVGAEAPPEGDEVFSVYLQAKAAADAAVQASDREWTVVRPGHLLDDPGSGQVRIDVDPFRGQVPRDDVAAVLDAVLHDPRSARRTFYVNGGDIPIAQALEAILT